MSGLENIRGSERPTFADDVKDIVSAFAIRWRLILLCALAFLAVGIGYVWVAAPGYTSSVEIFIDPRERKLTDSDVAPSGMGSSSQGADSALVDSQVSILSSRSVFSRLIEREGLEADPQFGGASSGGLRQLVLFLPKLLIYGPNAGNYGQMTPFERALDKLERVVTIKRLGQTYVLSVSVTTTSPQLSARIANALADVYLVEGQRAGDNTALEAATSMEARLTELQAKSAQSQQAVEEYRKQQGLIGAQGVLADERQLSDLTAQLVAASVATKAARAALDETRQNGVQASSSALSSDIAAQLRVQLDRALAEENVLAGTYGARHPRLVQARETRVSLQRALEAELGRVTKRASSDYQKALQTENALKAMLGQYEERIAGSNLASVKLRELDEVAARDRALYDSFATRAKQAREQVALPTTTARIISKAEPASRPSEPKVPLVLVISLFLGGILGMGVAWMQHLFGTGKNRDISRDPAPLEGPQVARYPRAAE